MEDTSSIEEQEPLMLENKWEKDIKVVLNGGGDTLDNATVPFTFGLSPELIDKQPTHVLIIDRTEDEKELENLAHSIYEESVRGRRYLVELSDASNFFIEFYKSGKHNLLFLFFDWSDLFKETIKSKRFLFLQKEDMWGYKQALTSGCITGDVVWKGGYVGFCEKEIVIPAEFFSQKPQSGFWKLFYKWVNMWKRDSPMDDCDFRDRALRAMTYELIPRLGWLFLRYVAWYILLFVIGILATVIVCLVSAVCFIVGRQLINADNIVKLMWKDLVKGTINDWDDWVGNAKPAFNQFKQVTLSGATFYLPVSILGALVILFFTYDMVRVIRIYHDVNVLLLIDITWIVFQLRYIIKRTQYAEYNDEGWLLRTHNKLKLPMVKPYSNLTLIAVLITGSLWSFYIIRGLSRHWGAAVQATISILTMLVVVVIAAAVIIKFRNAIVNAVDKFIEQLYEKRRAKEEKRLANLPPKTDTYKQYLRDSYNMNAFPSKITAAALPKATTKRKRIVQVFRTKFYDTKSKICRPYEL